MTLRHKILLFALLPLILAVGATMLIVNYQSQELAKQEIRFFKHTMLNAKKAELLNYVSLALTSIEHLYEAGSGRTPEQDEAAKAQARQILNRLSFGSNGYFFVYDFKGRNLVHPKQPWRVGKNYWELTDRNGRKVIQNLIKQARQGGGYYQYSWEQPSSNQIADKIGYAVALDRWQWMVGTGIYIDDVAAQVAQANTAMNERISQTFLMISLVTLGAVLCVFLTGLAINIRETRLADTKLHALTRKIVETQEEERGRIARELHDGISQVLVSVRYTLDHAKRMLGRSQGETENSIDLATENLNMAIREVRQISHDLRPGMLDDLGLAKALENLGANFAKRTNIEVVVQATALRDLLSAEAKTTLFRIAQEALTNIERHAQATRVELRLGASRKGVTLEIADNGKGFDLYELRRRKSMGAGIGLKNMEERLEPFDGHLDINSSPSGTRVAAQMPLRAVRVGNRIREPLGATT